MRIFQFFYVLVFVNAPNFIFAQESHQLIQVSTDTLWLLEKVIDIENRANLDDHQLSDLVHMFLAGSTSQFDEPALFQRRQSDSLATLTHPEDNEQDGIHNGVIEKLNRTLLQNNTQSIEFLTDSLHVERAKSIYRMLLRNKRVGRDRLRLSVLDESSNRQTKLNNEVDLTNRQQKTFMPPIVRFRISNKLQKTSVKTWRLTIWHSVARVGIAMAGRGSFPSEILWDWKNVLGEFATPGRYSYTIVWKSVDGITHTAVAGYFILIRQVRHVTLSVSNRQEVSISPKDSVFLFIRR